MDHAKFFKTACWFEASLVIVALVLGQIADINPFAQLYFSETAVLVGLLGTVPLFMLFLSLQYLPQKSLLTIKDLLMKTLAPSLQQRHWTDLLLLATIAGIAEELLFRGVLQPWIAASWGLTAGLWASNIIFGLVHAITPMYALLVILVGVYLSLSMTVGGDSNLLIPIIIHSLYDFLAFIALIRMYKASLGTPEA
jgi:membrane protease YdiL (CAAX protease family)